MKISARCSAIAFLATSAILSASDAWGANLTWLPSSPALDWSTSTNWSGGVVPTTAYSAYIVNGGTANVTTNGDICYALALGGGSSGTVNMTGGSLHSAGESIGDQGTGVFTQSGGTNATPGLFLGYHPGGNGTYGLSNGSLTATSENIGYYGTGVFTQTGGTHAVSVNLAIGTFAGSSGSYGLSGSGLLITGNSEYIGYQGSGCFAQSGGTHEVTGGNLLLGDSSNTSGSYDLSGSGLLSAQNNEYIGYGDSGSFTQWGGTHIVNKFLYIGYYRGSSGSYDLQCGSLSTVNEYVGYNGSGNFVQSGGTHTVQSSLCLGQAAGGSATYALSGSGLLSAPYEYVGYPGSGSFLQTGGTNSAGNLNLAYSSGFSGTYMLNAGLLNLSSLIQGSGSAAFNFSGGTFQAAQTLSTSVPIVLATAGSDGVFDNNGNALTLSGDLSGPGGLHEIGSGLLVLSGVNTYGGGTIVEEGTLEALDNSALPAGSSLTVGADASLLFGGSVEAASPAGNLQAVPEPSTLALFLAALWSAVVHYRFRRPQAFGVSYAGLSRAPRPPPRRQGGKVTGFCGTCPLRPEIVSC
jgi:autotransporter-associated beta strand protein